MGFDFVKCRMESAQVEKWIDEKERHRKMNKAIADYVSEPSSLSRDNDNVYRVSNLFPKGRQVGRSRAEVRKIERRELECESDEEGVEWQGAPQEMLEADRLKEIAKMIDISRGAVAVKE